MVLVAFPLFAITVTKNPVLIAGVAVAGQLPWLLFSLPAGAIADRVNRKRLVAGIESVRALVLVGFGLSIVTGHRSLIALYAATFTIGAGETAFWAATSATLPALVGREWLPTGNGYLQAADTAGEQFAGPAAGGVLFNWYAAAPFLGDAISFVASALFLIRAIPASPRQKPPAQASLMADVRSGLQWFFGNGLLRLLAVLIATFAFCQAIILGVLVLYGVRTLHLNKASYGLFLAVGAFGSVAGGMLAGRIHARLRPQGPVVAAGLLASAGCLLLAGTSWVVVAAIGLAIQALAVSVGNVSTISIRQAVIPAELLGRVNNIFRMWVWGVMPLGALVGGFMASQVGLHTTFLIAGLVQLTVVLLLAGRLRNRMAAEPALRTQRSVRDAEPVTKQPRLAETQTRQRPLVAKGRGPQPQRQRPLVAEGRTPTAQRQRPLVAKGRPQPPSEKRERG
jgi:MFS family permease